MSVEVTKVCRETFPAVRFIGKCYSNADRGADGGFGNKWGEWFQNGWFEKLEEIGYIPDMENGYVGLMGCSENEGSFQYWIGVFTPENTNVPDGYSYVDIPAGDVGVCWIYGREDNGELYGQEPHNMCMAKLQANGMDNYREELKDGEKWWWYFERYNCPRFTTPDENGKVILDYGMYIG